MIKDNQSKECLSLDKRLEKAKQNVKSTASTGKTKESFCDKARMLEIIHVFADMKLKDVFADDERGLQIIQKILDVTEDTTYQEMAHLIAENHRMHDFYSEYGMETMVAIWAILCSNKRCYMRGAR